MSEPSEAGAQGTKVAGGKAKNFGMSPQEAGRKGAQVREERKRAQAEAAAAASDGRVVFVRTPVALGDIVARLSTLAAKGDTSAARELRSWLTEYPVEETTDIAALDRRTREALKAELLVRIQTHSPAAPMPDGVAIGRRDDGSVGSGEGEATPAAGGTPLSNTLEAPSTGDTDL